MSRIFITGSSDGLGLLAAKALIENGHQVVVHGRNHKRTREALEKAAGAETGLTADLSDIAETIELAAKVNALGKFDAVIHNAGLYQATSKDLFTVNTLAPYILTCLIQKPKRLIYVSSDMHLGGTAKLGNFKADHTRFTYSDTKLHVLMLAMSVARKWPNVYANALHPGWVPTKMGGRGAPDDLEKGYETQVWLATSDDNKAKVSGRYFFHRHESRYHRDADDIGQQEEFLRLCAEFTGVKFPMP